ncbi:MAG: hypothetical protein JW850_18165 [Thermoflexales bacterium]|nr:hypothetical protein [Thermoflexales bacterium]
MDYDRVFAQFDDLQERASVDAVYGQPVEIDGKVVVPVAGVSYAFGLGLGEGYGPRLEGGDQSSGSGGGGFVRARPVAVVEITPECTRVEGVVDEQLVVLAGIAFAAWLVFWISRTLMCILGARR